MRAQRTLTEATQSREYNHPEDPVTSKVKAH